MSEFNERPSEPLFLVPWQVPAFAGLFLAIHVGLQLAPIEIKNWAYAYLQLVPARFLVSDNGLVAVAFGSLVSHAFLHFDWLHVLVNCAMLMAGAGPVMRNCGVTGLWAMFLLSAIAGGVCHVLIYWGESGGVIGASGGAAGVIAAAFRYRTRKLSLGELVAPITRPPVWTFTIFWIGINAALFLWDTIGGSAVSGYATIAHIGGYLAGLFLAPVLIRGARPKAWSPRP